MRETLEFRIPEEAARRVLRPNDGEILGDSVRKIELPAGDHRIDLVREAEITYRARGESFFTSWNITRQYSKVELASAELFRLLIVRVFEPSGIECGTRYSNSNACSNCGVGERQIGFLRLDLSRMPKGVDIARSISDEWVVSQRLAETLLQANITGIELSPVQHR